MQRHQDIPLNLITGFLGVGKTTAIRHLLAQRPEGEHWAVLVNEFGEIGVDGGLLADTGVALEEIPGGCLCCVSAQMFTVGLNRLIRSQKPDRILIEPTGLGHPAQIIRTLTEPPYAGVLDLRATVTLMDARHLASPRHREHPNWQDQIALADVLLANKADLYSDDDREALQTFVAAMPAPRPVVVETTHGRIEREWLDRPRLDRGGALFPEARAFLDTVTEQTDHGHDHAHDHEHEHDHGHDHAMPTVDEWVTIDTRGDGYIGRSWLLPEGQTIDHATLANLVDGFTGDRLKGLVETERGWHRLNRVDVQGGLEPMKAPSTPLRPRIEAILPESDAAALDHLAQTLEHAQRATHPT
ncbi:MULTISPECIES: GTP-binding protein [unclassified Thioalkalivibrio]|uniref:CobW family GTP-binding protein n=1 Tax=unclassified Thioalkalivibrio TaxID=2621013 RepID=UPI000363080F|nr:MULTISPECIES: GTP-binding protein [unclassified Thioalkalivibrio]